MSNTNTGADLPTLSTEATARAVAVAEETIEKTLMGYAEDEDAYIEVGEDDESYVDVTADGFEVGVYVSGDSLHLWVTVKLDRDFKVTDDGVEAAFADDAADAAAEAYTYAAETGFRSARE